MRRTTTLRTAPGQTDELDTPQSFTLHYSCLSKMSKDSSSTYLHMHHPRLVDHFEDFTRPHTSLSSNATNTTQNLSTTINGTVTTATGATVTYGATSTPSSTIPSFLPIEEVYLPPHYQPINPEDEDDVVPDQHAAFGIARAMDAAGRRRVEPVWRDLGLQELVRGETLAIGGAQRMVLRGTAATAGGGGGGSTTAGGVSFGFSSAAAGLRVRESGSLMGGRRVRCLR
ncbi:Apc13 domain protein [Talaromyces stipitatus ATCC 10500]|uniref:Apc13 domain protein n=1 Tax=Talaromyces stipitatus (strain ATCC 10500 / CBS 375.48 / QM 6759 / NRRL 1006) TaxID=441959 RepID=B8LYH9_TALSN|nr:Apc13 domain protein [Talaromyces stipitatus ATCC 10500]EED22908.1 Apc13 domain protein [Talaromyces stipitatus ATCC 10500]